jgi:hypothetical protein
LLDSKNKKTKTKQNKTAKTKNNTFVLQIKPERKSKLRKSLICYSKKGFYRNKTNWLEEHSKTLKIGKNKQTSKLFHN